MQCHESEDNFVDLGTCTVFQDRNSLQTGKHSHQTAPLGKRYQERQACPQRTTYMSFHVHDDNLNFLSDLRMGRESGMHRLGLSKSHKPLTLFMISGYNHPKKILAIFVKKDD